MTPPLATPDHAKCEAAPQPAVSFCLTVLRKRADFLLASRAKRQAAQGLLLQARYRRDDDPLIRVGYTCSKKLGNAVARNRAKRRLREVARLVLPVSGQKGWDYVLVGRAKQTSERPFALLLGDLRYSLTKIHHRQGSR